MKILGYDYKVTPVANMGEHGCLGLFVPKVSELSFDCTMDQQGKESTVLHEIIEALSWHLGLEMTEAQIRGIEAGLYGTLTGAGVDLGRLVP